jgi:protein O-GlcNAc transferase
MEIDKATRLADEFFQKGNLTQAESVCREILSVQPNNADALHLLGIIYYEVGKYDLAMSFLSKTLHLHPANADVCYDIGNIALDQGKFDEAGAYYQKALELNPNHVDAYNNLGNSFHEKGKLDEAISCYQKALQINPGLSYVNNNLGLVLQDKGRLDDAITYYQKALELNPKYIDASYNLGNAFQRKDQPEKAISYYRRAIDLNPDFAEAHHNLGNALKDCGLLKEALASYNRALAFNQESADIYLNIGYILDYQGRKEEAVAAFGEALARRPNFFPARYAICMSQLPVLYSDQADISIARKNYNDQLLKLRDTLSIKNQADIESASNAVGSLQPFLLAYQGFDDTELQQIYGGMVCKIMALRYPQYSERPRMPDFSPGEKIRVGIVSGFFYRHSNWKIPIKGWIENLDKRRFTLHGYYTGKVKDEETEVARKCFTRFIENISSFDDLCRIIRGDQLQMLIYPEIGMDAMTLRLASLWIAPVQCSSWGHPDTSGLPTIDYYLSSDLMEPPDADFHYTERLVRLPNLSIYYRPLDVPDAPMNRDHFGLSPDSVLYLCCQSLFKYLPQYDWVFPRIAREVNNCQFLFISDTSDWITGQFRSRISLSFHRFGLNADDYVILLPHLDPGEYHAVNLLSDIYLDSIGWSGCNSTFEAVACGLPVVTLPGELMRGRHSSAILTMMGVTETTAGTLDEYVMMAVRLAQDQEWRRHISDKIAGNRRRIYQDRTCISALEDFIERAVGKTTWR